jgi:hypothetical protein
MTKSLFFKAQVEKTCAVGGEISLLNIKCPVWFTNSTSKQFREEKTISFSIANAVLFMSNTKRKANMLTTRLFMFFK